MGELAVGKLAVCSFSIAEILPGINHPFSYLVAGTACSMRILPTLCLLIISMMTYAQSGAPRIGQHAISLQWISWDKPGSAQITKAKDGTFRIIGRQRSDDKQDSLRIDGKLMAISPTELRFTGKIITRIHHIHGGAPCIRDGEYTFLITGKRRYWRLQEMLNCSGVETDYVDIYF